MARRKPKKPPKPLSRAQLLERDPWHFDRTHPVFRAILKVLIDHPTVSYYAVDWRPYLAGRCARPVRDREPICGSMSKPFNEGGGGYLERFAIGVIAQMHGVGYMELVRLDGPYSKRDKGARCERLPEPVKTASEALMGKLCEDYEREKTWIEHVRRPRLGLVRVEHRTRRGFDRLMRDCGVNKRLLGLLDREVERQQAKAAQTNPTTPTPRRTNGNVQGASRGTRRQAAGVVRRTRGQGDGRASSKPRRDRRNPVRAANPRRTPLAATARASNRAKPARSNRDAGARR